MVFNRENDGLIQTENDQKSDERAISTRLADDRTERPNSNSITSIKVNTTGEQPNSLANEKKIGSKLHADVSRLKCASSF